MLFPLLAACVSSGAPDDSPKADTADTARVDTGDTAGDDTGDATLPADLNGAPPAAPVALPTFSARNQDGQARSEADLLGHPTVMWFYPAAGTFG